MKPLVVLVKAGVAALLVLTLFILSTSFATLVTFGPAGSDATTGVLDATLIPSTTTSELRYQNVNNEGYDIVISTSGLGKEGEASFFFGEGWWFEGSPPYVSSFAQVEFRFYQGGTTTPIGLTGVHFRFEDAERTERFKNFTYRTPIGTSVPVTFDNGIFSYSAPPVLSSGNSIVENGSDYEGGTQQGKWIDVNLASTSISGFSFQAHRTVLTAGSVIMTGLGDLADPPMDFWRAAEFGADADNPAIAGDTADPDGDGISNLLEYALALNPRIPSTEGLPVVGLITITSSPNNPPPVQLSYITISFNRPISATDVTYLVEVSSNMVTWLPGSNYSGDGDIPDTVNTTEVSRTLAGPIKTIVVRDNVAIDSTNHRYIRLRVSHP